MASPMKQWRKDHDVSQSALAADMGQSASTLSQKENGHLGWQQKDLLFLYDHYGLSADFVLGINNLPSCEKAITCWLDPVEEEVSGFSHFKKMPGLDLIHRNRAYATHPMSDDSPVAKLRIVRIAF